MKTDANSFSERIEKTFESLFDQLTEDDALVELDVDLIDGVLRIDFDNGAVIVISRQESMQQIWVASPQGPAHFILDNRSGRWINNRTSESLSDFLGDAIGDQIKCKVVIADPI